jgi:hypothetical protein
MPGFLPDPGISNPFQTCAWHLGARAGFSLDPAATHGSVNPGEHEHTVCTGFMGLQIREIPSAQVVHKSWNPEDQRTWKYKVQGMHKCLAPRNTTGQCYCQSRSFILFSCSHVLMIEKRCNYFKLLHSYVHDTHYNTYPRDILIVTLPRCDVYSPNPMRAPPMLHILQCDMHSPNAMRATEMRRTLPCIMSTPPMR